MGQRKSGADPTNRQSPLELSTALQYKVPECWPPKLLGSCIQAAPGRHEFRNDNNFIDLEGGDRWRLSTEHTFIAGQGSEWPQSNSAAEHKRTWDLAHK